MKYLALIVALMLAGCEVQSNDALPNGRHLTWPAYQTETPAMNLPLPMRQHNWGGGSCVHASTVMNLRWQGYPNEADMWRQKYSGGESSGGLKAKLDHEGFTWAATDNGDVNFLEWATRTRRGAVIFYYPNHSICFCGHHGDYAYLLDNNREDHYITVPWNEFVRDWHGYGGFALSIIGVPPAPIPNYPNS